MRLTHRIRILTIRIPQRRAHDFIPCFRIHDLQPAGATVGAVFAHQTVAEFGEARWGGVRMEEAPEVVGGCGVAFADAVD